MHQPPSSSAKNGTGKPGKPGNPAVATTATATAAAPATAAGAAGGPLAVPSSEAASNGDANHAKFMIPMIRSDSTDWSLGIHDYGTALDYRRSSSLYRRNNNNMAALVDDLNSPTSIYTTESSVEEEDKEVAGVTALNTNDDDHDEEANHNNNTAWFPSRTKAPLDPTVVPTRQAVNKYWTHLTEGILHRAIVKMVVLLSTTAATYPFTTILGMAAVSVVVLGVGFFTSFQLITESDVMFTPIHSPPTLHHEWLQEESGFHQVRPLMMILHKNGNNVLGKQPLEKLFEAVDTVRDTFGYDDLCRHGGYIDFNGDKTCRILAATRFWNHNKTLFEQQVISDQDAIDIMSQDTYQAHTSSSSSSIQTPVFREMILGNAQLTTQTFQYRQAGGAGSGQTTEYAATYVNHTGKLHFVQSLVVRMELPNVNRKEADLLETLVLDRLKDLKEHFEQDPTNDVQLDFLSIFAYQIENQRALLQDMPLILGIFLVLVVFTTLVFHKRHKVYSRSMLGCASLMAIGFSLCLSYGVVWLLAIPFTNIAQILPFMVMGVGLDDTFIITGEYFRTDSQTNIVTRIEQTMEQVGLSITLTSLTTMLAFALGSMSTIPGVRWLCFYAFAAIAADYIFQITFFVALLVLDERRVQAHQQNCCFWRPVPRDEEGADEEDDENDDDDDNSHSSSSLGENRERRESARKSHRHSRWRRNRSTRGRQQQSNTKPKKIPQEHFSERFMLWYGDLLMRPIVKILVILGFAAYFGFSLYRATLLTQEFNVEDYVPADSYLRGTLYALDEYYSLKKPMQVYFRDVDQSDPEIQQQMRDYISELATLPQIGEEPPYCWVNDFPRLQEKYFDEQYAWVENLTFTQRVTAALNNPTIREIYGEDIVQDDDGNITASRCLLFLRNLDLDIVTDQIDMLQGQRDVTKRQPINQDRDEWAFFSFDTIFFYWELYAQAVRELLFTIVTGIVAVTMIAFILIPHWSAVVFVLPGICILYCNFLGTMQWMGLHINSLTYVIVVMAIGILVDFLVHILLRYYETTNATREEKVKETLRTMGASMFVGGATTFLSVCPLIFSTTHIFMTVFWAFAGIVALGFTHGLILLPVVLSFCGPIATHQGPPPPVKIPEHITKELSNQQTGTGPSTEMSPTASESSPAHQHDDTGVDNDVFRSSTDEELEVLKPDVQSEDSLVKGPFTYQERESSHPENKKRKAPPFEEDSSDGAASPPQPKKEKSNTIAEPTGVYCGLDLTRFSIYDDTSIVKVCANAECKSPTNACKPYGKPRNNKNDKSRDPSPSRPRRSKRDPSPSPSRPRRERANANARVVPRSSR